MKLANAKSGFEFDCQDTLEIMDLYVVFPDDLTSSERNDAAEHMLACESCRNEYLQMKLTDTALRVNRDWLKESGVFGESETNTSQVEMGDKEIAELRFKAMMDRASARRKRRERKERIAKINRFVKPVAAVAACLVAAFGIYLAVDQLNDAKNTSTPTVAVQPHQGSVKIELVSDTTTELIPAGQIIATADKLKTLRINGNRQMILNAGTELSIEPYNLGCVVKLAYGEIYTEVEHDGKPFIVETAHGRAVITGTTFNIKADDEQMELVVAEGTVSFKNDKGSVNVTAGHKSLLAFNNKPSLPVPCDTRQLTAWATGINDMQEIVAATSYESEIILTPMFGSEPIDLEGIDYDSWVKEKQDWFKREFPHIFKLKAALAKDGIEVSYPELLIKSGDLWRFEYPAKSNTQLVSASGKSLLNLASVYGKDKQWLISSVGAIGSFNPTAKTSLDAFDKWADAINTYTQQPNSDLLLYSLHASVYLAETRTFVWLAIKNDMVAVKTSDKAELLRLLEKEVEAACSLVTQNKRLLVEDHKVSACDESGCRELLQGVVENIEEITEIEKKIVEYEIISK